MSGFIPVIDQDLDNNADTRRGKLHFSLRSLGYFLEQRRTNTQPSEIRVDTSICF